MPSNTEYDRRRAEKYLAGKDPVLARLIIRFGNCPLSGRSSNPYSTLVRSIISQQLSSKAADTIEQRLLAVVGDWDPITVLEVPAEVLRTSGLSSSKARCLREIAGRVVDGRLDFDNLAALADEKIIVLLTEITGIGRWTAEMFLIFGLGRPDVLALADAGLKRAVRQLYGTDLQLETVGEPWRPFRSIASWYLWKHLDS